ncbi:hypothetical protein [Methanoregula sp. UBA64]|uniref:hypothetical protein n=1 Tax=Methanoregula sp. UBA64 TaxID=1915554 RepID=UPI0025DCDAE1|nr:hypothetical protein [Methanoregula sp. UBA64]
MSKLGSNRPLSVWKIFLLCIMAGTVLLALPVSAADKPVVTVAAQGAGAYYLGEKAILSGINTDTGSTYLYITGPNLPESGGKLTAPDQKVVSGNADTFTVVSTKPDKTWQYPWYTAGLRVDAGSYTIYAASEPKAGDQLADTPYGTTSIIIKKPYIAAEISPLPVTQGQPFTITGTAVTDGNQSSVQVWIFGDNFAYHTTTPVNPDASFAFTGNAALSENLPAGQNYLVVQHPMADNTFDFVVSGDSVRDVKQNNGMDLFKITGSGSLQGSDAADALVAAISARETHDSTYTNDTYTIIPFKIANAGSPAAAPASGTSTGAAVTISADGSHSYYQGEKVILRGKSSTAGTVYLFMTGPTTFKNGPGIPASGGKLTSPLQAVVSGNPDTFTEVTTKPDKTWEYSWYTDNLNVDAGTYTVYAESQPKAADQPDSGAADVGIALKKPYITANMSSLNVVKGQPVTVTGIAEGIPPEVQVWIFGDKYAFTTKTPVSSDGDFTFTAGAAMSGNLPEGQNYLIVEHPMADNKFDFVVNGAYVRDLKLANGTDLFKITGPGNLQGSDAADALITAITTQNANDDSYTNDTYTIIPFKVTSAGSTSPAGSGVTISADGTQSYYLGEKVVLRGKNTRSGSTYLFLTGPNLAVSGVKLTSPKTAAASGSSDTFTVAATKPDNSWEYSWYTADLPLDAGTYTIYAADGPETADQPDAANVGIIVKKPFIMAMPSTSSVIPGQPFTVTGTAEGQVPEVQVWIIGDNSVYTAKTPVNPDATFTFTVDAALSGKLTAGQNYLFVQHPMQNNRFDIDISGEYVRNEILNNGTNLFRISGPGSLQGADAADALVAAFSDTGARDDTYTVIPIQVTGAGSKISSLTPIETSLRSLETALRSLF